MKTKSMTIKRLFILLTAATLFTTQLALCAPRASARPSAAEPHVLYFVGVSTRSTITVENPHPYSTKLAVTAFSASGVNLDESPQEIELPSSSQKQFDVSRMPSGTVTVRIESSASVRAYAYEESNNGAGAAFVPPLNSAVNTLTFPQMLENDLATKTFIIFNPNDQIASVELVAYGDSGLEVARSYVGPLLPRQTLEVAPTNLWPAAVAEDVSTVAVSSSVPLMGRQRLGLPRGENVTWPAVRNGQAAKSQVSVQEPKESATPESVNTTASPSLDDYPYKTMSHTQIDPYGFYFRNCTSFAAWRMNRDAGTTDPLHPSFFNTMNNGHWGDASNWSVNAQKLNYRIDGIPEIGAIAQWNKNECNGCANGHVAYVESINGDGSVNLSEYNFTNSYAFDYRPNVPVSRVGRFIHILTRAGQPTAHFNMSAQNKTATDGQTLSLTVPVNGNVTVNFASTSIQGSAPITNYVWKSNGTQICSNSSNCSFNFGTASNTISLTVTDSNGLTSTATGQVNLTFQSSGPTAHFNMSAQNKTATDGQTLSLTVPVNGNVTVNFASTSIQGSAPITNYVWKSNGTQICSNSSNCSFNFGTASNTISLTVTDSNGLTSTATGQVNLTFQSSGPTAHFNMSAQNKTATDGQTLSLTVPVNGNVTVNFASTSIQGSAPITNYVWKSNGTQICSNSSNCSFNFGTASNTISLTVTDSNGLTSTATGQVNLTFQSSGPTAHFNMSAQNKTATDGQTLSLTVPVNGNVTVNFASTSIQGSAPITNYVWKSNGTQICSNSSNCSFNFGTASNTISLTVTDSNGLTSTATGQVNLTFQSSGPTAHFNMSAQNKTATDGQTLSLTVPVNGNVTVNFASTSIQGSAPITNYVWKSNGTQICSNSSNCSFNFGTASNTISLTVTDSNGLTSTATGQVNLTFQSSGPTAHFNMSAQNKTATDGQTLSLTVPVNGNVTVNFASTSIQGSAPITNYVWKSNGTQICSNSSNCSFNFGTASNTISLTVTDSNGLTSTATGQVNLTFQ